MIRAVIWDMGGVILRTEDPQPRTRLAQRYNLTRPELETLVFASDSSIRCQSGQITQVEHWQNVYRQLQVPAELQADFQKEYWGGDWVDKELVDYIHSLRTERTTALLSNAFENARATFDAGWGFLEAFDLVIFSSEVGLMKPDLAIYQLIIEKLGIRSHEAIFIDDVKENVQGARQAGLHSIQFLNTAQTKKDLTNLLNS